MFFNCLKKKKIFLVSNQIKTPDGIILKSRHQHDFVHHYDKNNVLYFVDGGLAYLKRSLKVIEKL